MSKRLPDGPRRVTMSDVARRAGVSQPTVSFVLNDRRDVVVAEETRRRVLAAAAEMDFVPNRAAQHLRSNRSYLIGVVANGIVSQPYAGRIILGIQQVVQPADHLCLVDRHHRRPGARRCSGGEPARDRGRRHRVRLTGAERAAPQSPP